MICKGGTRSYPSSLAQHLLKTDNERVVVVELRHTATQDLKQALNDMHATIAMTQGRKSLYHAQINPAKGEQMTPTQWNYAADEMEKRLGFTDQPRVVVYHEKKGRPHLHVVWQRTDVEKGKVIETGNDYYIHKKLGRDLERKFNHKELKADFSNDWEKMNEREQTARDGYLSPKQLKARITEFYKKNKDPKAFQEALKKAGFELAKGKRGVVIISPKNQIHSLVRYTGQKKKDIEKRLKPILERLPDATELVKQRENQQSKTQGKKPRSKTKAKTIVENAFDILNRDEIGKTAAKFDKLKREFKQKQFDKLRQEFTDNQDAFNNAPPTVKEGFEQMRQELARQNEEERKRQKEREFKR